MFIPFEPGEELILKVHRHWLFIVIRIIGLAVFMAAPVAVALLLTRFRIISVSVSNSAAFISLWALWALIGWTMFWQFWTTYYMDIWVVTNRRIIDIDYHRLFDRNIAILRLDRVEDISTRVQGLLGTLFKYGSVVVQTAGTEKEFVIDQISNPERLQAVISAQLGRPK
jgi:PH (Pleckstrin Homology) domain-containing protein